MKVLKPGQSEDPKRRKSTDIYEDIICDKCGKSCRDDEDMNFEYAEIEACWGFCSKKDLEHHKAQVCEACYDTFGLTPEIANHLFDKQTPSPEGLDLT